MAWHLGIKKDATTILLVGIFVLLAVILTLLAIQLQFMRCDYIPSDSLLMYE